VAVRSSAADEDGGSASFAGQHETYLNVVGEEAVAQAVVRCWASARSERVLAYRRQQGMTTQNIGVAVLVQQLVSADISGVVFSANPITGNASAVMINASWGLGESLVSGAVTPDTYLVDKRNLEIVARHIGAKERMTIRSAAGTCEVDVPRFLRSLPVLNDQQINEMAQLAIDLEQAMGWPVDVECAIERNQLYLLQCRPITTLHRSPAKLM
jgi:pyruvate,water dikinase